MILEKRLRELERAEAKLQALEAGGVDNWEWYDESLKEFREEVELLEEVDNLMEEVFQIVGEGAYEPSERGAGFALDEGSMAEAARLVLKFVREKHEQK